MSTGSHSAGVYSRPDRSRSAAALSTAPSGTSQTPGSLEVVTPLFIPDRFTLIVPTDQLKRPCHVAWRKDRRIGIAFDL